MYQWWVYLHLLGVFGFLISHGVSVGVTFRLRTEREPQKVQALLQMSSASINGFYPSMGLLLAGGIAAAFAGDLWGYGWIWASIAALVVVTGAMYAMARPYYRRLRFITGALVDGSQAVSPEQYDHTLRSPRAMAIAWIGFLGLALLLYLMLFKPTLGMAPDRPAATAPESATPAIAASELAFDVSRLIVPSSRPVELSFDNRSTVPHNLAIRDRAGVEIYTGEIFAGPRQVTYPIPALEPGTYTFLCVVHPDQMAGTLVAR